MHAGVCRPRVLAAAGVSAATVSKVLNNAHDVSHAMRDRVRDAIERSGYVPREQQGRPTVLAVVIQQVTGHALDFGTYVAATLEGVSTYCRRHAIELAILADERIALDQRDVLRDLRRRKTSCVLVLRGDDASRWIDRVAAAVPTLALHLPRTGTGHDELVRCDEAALGRLAAQHLLAAGCRRVALLAAPPGNPAAERRLAGFRRAWRRAGGAGDELSVYWSDGHHDAQSFGSEAAQQAVAGPRPVDGIFTTDIGIAHGVYHGLWLAGCRPGHEVAVVGSDEYPEAAWTTPPLTTVGWCNVAVGSQAAAQLHRLVRGQRPEPIDIPIHLTPRLSSRLA